MNSNGDRMPAPVTVNDLFAKIGQLQIENDFLRAENAQLRAERSDNPTNGESTVPTTTKRKGSA